MTTTILAMSSLSLRVSILGSSRKRFARLSLSEENLTILVPSMLLAKGNETLNRCKKFSMLVCLCQDMVVYSIVVVKDRHARHFNHVHYLWTDSDENGKLVKSSRASISIHQSFI